MSRLQRDIKDLLKCNVEDIGIAVCVPADMTDFDAFIKGPSGTPYEGGVFEVNIIIPEAYPYEPPKVKFVTKVWHPNISSRTGYICLNILDNDWCGTMNLRCVLLSVQNLLSNPAPDDAQDDIVGRQCLCDHNNFVNTAKLWTNEFASGSHNIDDDFERSVKVIADMGVPRETAIVHLSNSNWNIEEAVDTLYC